MECKSFLRSVAKAYASRNGGKDDLSEYCFIFPNRRSGTFFLKYLAEELGGRTGLAPEVLPTGEFMSRIAGLDVAPRVTQLFELYLAYKGIKENEGGLREDELLDFDKFLPWGEVVISDFSEVDLYDVDAQEIFNNVVDYRTITSNFLTDEQKEIIERYFGYSPDWTDVRGFWKSFEGEDSKELKKKYLTLWQQLPELYTKLRDRLEHPRNGFSMCMSGSVYRIALEKVREHGMEALPWRRIVVVGLDWLSTTEAELFDELRKMRDDEGEPVIEFFWDTTGPVLTEKREPSSSAILRYRTKMFPEPEWAHGILDEARCMKFPVLEEIAVPSNAMQTKVAAEWVKKLITPENKELIDNARVAVVLPDENLLLPLLHSLPFSGRPEEDTKERTSVDLKNRTLYNVNLTMGWSMRYTAAASFMHHLQNLHRRRRKTSGKPSYLSSDIRLFLAQPLVQMAVGSRTAMELNAFMNRRHRRTMTYDELKDYSGALGILLNPIDYEAPLKESADAIEKILLYIDTMLAGTADVGAGIKKKVERMQLQIYITALGQITDAAAGSGIEMRFPTLFHLLNKLTAGEKISFEGEPLAGLQVMGLMETRALDFDKVLILSMNDKVMPRRNRKRTFIPDSLRRGYGLPLAMNDENRHGYWFYRLLSRAGQVGMVYDSRVGEGMRSGGRSRFLMQLDKLHARGLVNHVKSTFLLGGTDNMRVEMKKTPTVAERLEEFKSGGKNALSATALMAYIQCPLKFYYRFVLRYSDDPLPTGFIDAITQGNIFHDVMLRLYFREDERRNFLNPGKELSAKAIAAILEDDTRIREEMRMSILREQQGLRDDEQPEDRPLTASEELVAERLIRQVKGVLRNDLANAPVRLAGGEVRIREEWRINDSLKVNLSGSVDRVDYDPQSGNLRVVDFKTGSVHIKMRSLDDIFADSYESRNVLQLLLYANMMEKRSRDEGVPSPDVAMCIFDTNRMEAGEEPGYPYSGRDGAYPILSHRDERVADFMTRLKGVVEEIFDIDKAFTPTPDLSNCDKCVMAKVCAQSGRSEAPGADS